MKLQFTAEENQQFKTVWRSTILDLGNLSQKFFTL